MIRFGMKAAVHDGSQISDRLLRFRRLNQQMHWVSSECEAMSAFIENLGFYWLRPRTERRYIISALDHFFPWEMIEFADYVFSRGLANVHLAVDVAHAAISANMFNLLRS